jgi:transcriptional regulator of heat shock response
VSKTDSRGMYRTRHPSARRPSDAGRNEYVESPAKLERQFQKALERNRQRLDQQRERIKREAGIAQSLAEAD